MNTLKHTEDTQYDYVSLPNLKRVHKKSIESVMYLKNPGRESGKVWRVRTRSGATYLVEDTEEARNYASILSKLMGGGALYDEMGVMREPLA